MLANITLKDKTNITIGAFYRQPNTSLADIESLVTAVMDVRGNKTRVPEMIIGGDFNLPSIEWGHWGDEVKTRDPPSYGREINSRFIDVCDELGLTQVVRDPTRENNILDLMLVTSPDRCVDIQVNPGISDHDAVCLTYEGRVKINKKKPRTVFLFKRADMSSLKEDLKLYEQEEFIAHLGTGDINHTWNYFKMALSEMIKKNIPQRTITQNHRLPWVTASIRRLTRRRRRARKKARITNKAADWKRSKELDKETKIQLKEAHETYLKDIFTSETHRLTKKAWSYIKSQRRDNIGIPPLLNEKGELCEDAEDKAEILSRQYTSVFTQDNPLEPVPDVPYSLPSMPDINIEENGILKLLKEVNVYKAIGPDLIPNRILKDCCVELAPILTQIYKKSLREGRLPQEWLSANVTAIFKKGARHEASNYRPVSLTSVTCKIFEHVLFSQIMRHYTRP